jgi:hypothetical protein
MRNLLWINADDVEASQSPYASAHAFVLEKIDARNAPLLAAVGLGEEWG